MKIVEMVAIKRGEFLEGHDNLAYIELSRNGVRIKLHKTELYQKLGMDYVEVPGTVWSFAGHVALDHLAIVYGLQRGFFDCALPQQWVQAEYFDKGLPRPTAVWNYAPGSVEGNVVYLDEMLKWVKEVICEQH